VLRHPAPSVSLDYGVAVTVPTDATLTTRELFGLEILYDNRSTEAAHALSFNAACELVQFESIFIFVRRQMPRSGAPNENLLKTTQMSRSRCLPAGQIPCPPPMSLKLLHRLGHIRPMSVRRASVPRRRLARESLQLSPPEQWRPHGTSP